METTFKMRSTEFTRAIFDKIKDLLEEDDILEIKVYSESERESYLKKIKTSKRELEEGKTSMFTAEELVEYVKSCA